MDTSIEAQGIKALIKHPWKAVFLTGLFTGSGHVYAGAKSRGIFLIALTITLYFIIIGGMVCFFAFDDQRTSKAAALAALSAATILVAIHIFALFDAHKLARKFNRDHAIDIDATGQKNSWLSMFLSHIFPGIGQFYNGQVFKGVAFVVAAIGLMAAKELHYLLFFLYFALGLFTLKDAFDSAERRNGSSERFLYQGNGLLVLITAILFLNAMPYGAIVRENFLKAYKIPAGSMIPTLQIGDHLLISKMKKTRDELKRGDIVVFPYPENPEKNFIKRAIALGGDKVQFINGDLYINDQMVPKKLVETRASPDIAPAGFSTVTVIEEQLGDRTYRIQYLRDDHSSYNTGPFIVPKNAVFVLGDNRDNSMDSRVWGSVPRDTIEGKALKIYWSWDRDERKVNWERIGQTIF